MAPPAPFVSSATYSVSTPATPALRSAKKNAYGLPLNGKPARLVIVWPAVIGSPVPTAPIRTALPELSELYNWPSKISTPRMLVTVVLNCVDVDEPSVAYRTPPAAPPTQRSIPFELATPRGLLPDAQSVSPVVVLTFPATSTRPTTRGTAVDVVPARPVVGIA